MSTTTASGKRLREIRAGFIPLIDCAPLIVAESLGFARDEGLSLRLQRETSWATLRDRIAVRHLDLAHMLAPMPVAANLDLTPLPGHVVAPIALGHGGNTITVSRALWRELEAHGAPADLDAAGTARALAVVAKARRQEGARLVFAVVHPFSAHRYQLAYWLSAAGIGPDREVEIIVVPPPLMPAALAGMQVDGFCAGEPWGSIAVADGAGVIVTTNAHIWRASPEKVVGLRADLARSEPDMVAGVVRAVYRAACWCDKPENRAELAALLARPAHLNRPSDVLLTALQRTVQGPTGKREPVPGFLTFADRAATFPWISQALWFYAQMVRLGEAKLSNENIAAARSAYRPDLYRSALAPLGVTVPSANSKVEGGLTGATPVASPSGRLTLGPDGFFDGRVFDPDRLEAYIGSFNIQAG